MATIDWETVFRNYRVDYVDHGANVKRGNVNIQCPFCGSQDDSHHMGIDLETGWWGCWRNKSHRGKHPHRLVMALFKVTYKEADEIVGGSTLNLVPIDRIKEKAEKVLEGAVKEQTEVIGTFPEEFIPLTGSQRYMRYMLGRGFRRKDIVTLSVSYNLKCTFTGAWSDRIIFPVYALDGKLIGWYGRALGKSLSRYKAHPAGDLIKQHLYNAYQARAGGKVLVIVEGPIDALKIDLYGSRFGVRAVSGQGVSLRPRQYNQIYKLSKRFDKVVILYDVGTLAVQLDVRASMPGVKVKRGKLLEGFEDPGSIPYEHIAKQLKLLLTG